MRKSTRWAKRRLQCPEGKCETSLLVEWRKERGKEVLNGIICDNPRLENFHLWDCQWCCWEEISGEKK
ncbi:MAG: hypothetical protein ACE5OP_01855 [Candidatus Glassbacteria bacterium]